MAYRKKNIKIWKSKAGWCVDYSTPSLGKNLRICRTKAAAKRYKKAISN